MLFQAFFVDEPTRLNVDGAVDLRLDEVELALDLAAELQGRGGILNIDVAVALELLLAELGDFLLEPSKKLLLRTPSAELLEAVVVVAKGFHQGFDS